MRSDPRTRKRGTATRVPPRIKRVLPDNPFNDLGIFLNPDGSVYKSYDDIEKQINHPPVVSAGEDDGEPEECVFCRVPIKDGICPICNHHYI